MIAILVVAASRKALRHGAWTTAPESRYTVGGTAPAQSLSVSLDFIIYISYISYMSYRADGLGADAHA